MTYISNTTILHYVVFHWDSLILPSLTVSIVVNKLVREYFNVEISLLCPAESLTGNACGYTSLSLNVTGCPEGKKVEFITSLLDALTTDMVQAINSPTPSGGGR